MTAAGTGVAGVGFVHDVFWIGIILDGWPVADLVFLDGLQLVPGQGQRCAGDAFNGDVGKPHQSVVWVHEAIWLVGSHDLLPERGSLARLRHVRIDFSSRRQLPLCRCRRPVAGRAGPVLGERANPSCGRR